MAQAKNNMEAITFRLAGQEYSIDVMCIREIRGWTAATQLPMAPSYVLGVINLRGHVLPIINLAARMGLSSTPPTARHAIIVVEVHRQVFGLLVDGVSDIVTFSTEDIQATPYVASESSRSLVSGIIVREERMISLLQLDSVIPAPELSVLAA
jgi:purine-binding chemotaxis protein CheW